MQLITSVQDWPKIYKFDNPKINSRVIFHPTGNCQVCTIGAINHMLVNCQLEEQQVLIRDAVNTIKQRQMLVDIQFGYESKVEDLFKKENIVFKQNYKSTNGNSMVMYLFRVADVNGKPLI